MAGDVELNPDPDHNSPNELICVELVNDRNFIPWENQMVRALHGIDLWCGVSLFVLFISLFRDRCSVVPNSICLPFTLQPMDCIFTAAKLNQSYYQCAKHTLICCMMRFCLFVFCAPLLYIYECFWIQPTICNADLQFNSQPDIRVISQLSLLLHAIKTRWNYTPCSPLKTAKAEYTAVSVAVLDVKMVLTVVLFNEQKEPTIIFAVHQKAVALIRIQALHTRTKHLVER